MPDRQSTSDAPFGDGSRPGNAVDIPPAGGPTQPVTLTQVARIPLRRWRWLLAGALLGVLAVAGYLLLAPPSYHATSTVTVRAVVTNPFSYPGAGADRSVNMNVESGIATGGQVAARIAAATHQPAATVRTALQVEVPVGGQILRFDYTAPRSGQAVTGANAAARGYLAVRQAMYTAQRTSLLDSYDASIATATQQQAAATQRLNTLNAGGASNTSPEVAGATEQLRAADDQLTQLGTARAEIAAVDLTPGTLTQPAAAPAGSSRSHGALYLLAGLLAGLLIGALAALARESTDRRVRTAQDAAGATGLPLLGTVRHWHGDTVSRQARTDIRYLALALADHRELRAATPVVLLSPRADRNRSALAAELAVALARTGQRVYLAEAADDEVQLRPWVVAAARAGGPVSVVAAPEGEGEAIRVGTGSVLVGGPGGVPTDWRMLVDAPPAEEDETGVRLARSGAAVLVVAQDHTRAAELRRLVDRLRVSGREPAGVVLTGAPAGFLAGGMKIAGMRLAGHG
jgi:Mrp family chromosome partitioning ATPase